jgi:hypothetical protein
MVWEVYYWSLELPYPDPAIKRYIIDNESPFDGNLMVSIDGSHVATNWPEGTKPGLGYMPKYKDDYPRFKPTYVDDMQRFAQEELGRFPVAPDVTPYSTRLRALAEEEMRKSKEAQAGEDLAGAFQWAADALVTARSARALWMLESGRVEQTVAPR